MRVKAQLADFDEAFIACGHTLTADAIISQSVGSSVHRLAYHTKLIQ